MELEKNSYGIKLTCEMMVTSDIDVSTEDIVGQLVEELKIKKHNDGFLVNNLTMEYSVHKDSETIEV